jgi:hypothetical protein
VESLMPIDDLSELFAAERAVRAPSGAAERGLARLAGDVAAQVAPLPIAGGALKVGGSLVLKWLGVGFGAGVGGAALAAGAWSSAPVVASARPVASSVFVASLSSAATRASVPEAAAPTVTVELPALPVESARSQTPGPSTAPAAPQTFDAELALIRSAKGELDRGQLARAGRLLDEHATRFPSGVFAVDREGLRVLLRCAAHPDPALSRAFAARHPASVMTERLERACSVASGPSSTREFPK